MAVSDSATINYNVPMNQGKQVFKTTAELMALFSLTDASRCTIQGLQLFDTQENLIVAGNDLYTIMALDEWNATTTYIQTNTTTKDFSVEFDLQAHTLYHTLTAKKRVVVNF